MIQRFACIAGMIALAAGPCALAPAQNKASIGLWPAERQAGGVHYCYGNDWNALNLLLAPAVRQGQELSFGARQFQRPERFIETTVLEVTLPAPISFLGANIHDGQGVRTNFPVESVTRGGIPCQSLRVTLCNDTLNNRLVRNGYLCNIFIWFDAPEQLDAPLTYRLLHGERELTAGGCRLLTAGVLRAGRRLPERFGFYPWRLLGDVPGGDFDRMADFYRRLGIRGMFANAHAALNEKWQRIFEANRRHGIRNIAHMVHFVNRHGGTGWPARREQSLERGGLVQLMDEVCAGLTADAARADWEQLHAAYDMAVWDWEPAGPKIWPGYDDEAAIAVFARELGLAEPPTPAQLQSEYRERYVQFRMRQVARPLYALANTMQSVKPIHFRVEQGEGVGANVDYSIYDDIADAHSPMIYQPTPLRYAHRLLELTRNTAVPAVKFWPTITLGYAKPGVLRHTPGALMLDTMVTAAAGCGGISHWPAIYDADALWFGIHEGLARIALVEDFYFDGAAIETTGIEGLPYRRDEVALGHRTLAIDAPDWRTHLLVFAHRLRNETAITLINYHTAEDAFVQVNLPPPAGNWLVDPVNHAYLPLDENSGGALVRVPRESAGIWIATEDEARLADGTRLDAGGIHAQFESARAAFLAADRRGHIQIGAMGDCETAYGLTDFGGGERVALEVRTPSQTIVFGASGGRVYDWRVKDMGHFVASTPHAIAGLCKDLLWIPDHARWSGDEIQDYELAECAHEGNTIRVVYESDFSRALPGLHLRKTYRVPATGTTLRVEITLRNDTVDQAPMELAYWTHHTLTAPAAHFITGDAVHATTRGADTVFLAEGLADDLRAKVINPNRIAGVTGRACAEFFPAQQAGLIFHLPDGFMNVHRWSPKGRDILSSEWISQPFALPAGASRTLAYAITAVAGADVQALQRRLANEPAPADSASMNLFPYGFHDLDAQGMPREWNIRQSGAHTARVTVARDECGPILRAELPMETSVSIDTRRKMNLEPDTDYILTIPLKAEEMHHTGSWYKDQRGLWLYVFGGGKSKRYMVVHGEGSTDGWITAIFPFSTHDVTTDPYVFLRLKHMAGTVSFRGPSLVKQPAGMNLQRAFELGNGHQTPSPLRLRPAAAPDGEPS